jgi:serpin B
MNARERGHRWKRVLAILIAVAAALMAASRATAQQTDAPTPADAAVPNDLIKLISSANQSFAIDLYKQAARENPQVDRNLIVSPFSVTTALMMAADGARGQTAEQINFALYFSDAMRGMQQPDESGATSDLSAIHEALRQFTSQLTPSVRAPSTAPSTAPTTAPYTLSLSNALWVEQGYALNETFTDRIVKFYGLDRVHPLDFHNRPEPSRQFINLAVAAQTRQKITNFLPPGALDSTTRMMLSNAAYFKGRWSQAFPTAGTAKRSFRQDSTHAVGTMIMHAPSLDLPYFENEQVQAIALPYRGGNVGGQEMCMVILLPQRIDGLANLEASLLVRRIGEWCSSMITRKVDVYLPKFKAASQLDLEHALGLLGVRDAFSPERADFTGISPASSADRLYLNSVLHQTCVEVDEQGSEAAASTGAVTGVLGGTSIPREVRPILFQADHPFIFMIYHNPTGTILFIGRVSNPV